MNVLRFTYPPLRGEIYWPDMVGVGCLAAFAPQVVRTITAHPDQFIGHSDRDEGSQSSAAFHKRWLSQVEGRERIAVEGIVRRLFPKADAALGGSMYWGDWEARWRTELRVCSAAHFDKYFRLNVTSGAMSEAEWQEFVGQLGDRNAFKQRLLEGCVQMGRRGGVSQTNEVLDRLCDFVKIPGTPAQAREVFQVVMEVGDELARIDDLDMPDGCMPITNGDRVSSLLPRALAKLPSADARVRLVEETLRRPVGLYTAVDFVRVLGYHCGLYSSWEPNPPYPEPPLVPREKVEELAQVVVEKIEAAAADGSLAAHPSCTGIVWHWQLFGQRARATEWIRQLAQVDQQLLKMIRQGEGGRRPQTNADRLTTATPHIECEFLCQLIPALELRQRCSNLLATAPDWLTHEDRKAIQIVVEWIGEDGSTHDPRPVPRRAGHGTPFEPENESTDRHAIPSEEAEAIYVP